MSDIIGSGYGSDHDWKKDLESRFMYRGSPQPGTRYVCRDCGQIFVHHPDYYPGIFEEMEYIGIPRLCPGKAKKD